MNIKAAITLTAILVVLLGITAIALAFDGASADASFVAQVALRWALPLASGIACALAVWFVMGGKR